jgi:hypothetical protein
MAIDPDLYFANKLAGVDINAKLAGIADASRAKVDALKARKAEAVLFTAQLAEKQKAAEESWSGTDNNGFINKIASLASGASRVAGQLFSAPSNLGAAADTFAATDDEITAFNRFQSMGQLTDPETMAKLSRKVNLGNASGPRNQFGSYEPPDEKDMPTVLEVLQGAEKARGIGREINKFADVSSIVNKTNRDELVADLGLDFESSWNEVKSGWSGLKQGEVLSGTGNIAAGLARLLYNAGEAGITNPNASAEYVAENIPQLGMGAMGQMGKLGLGASNIGYAADEYQKGIDAYAKAHEGALPSTEERGTMAMQAAALALAEQVGDVSLLKGAKAATDVTASSFKQSLKNALGAGAKGMATEAATEGVQTYIEGEISGYDKQGYNKVGASALDIYTGATIGGIAGGGMSGGGRALAEITKTTPEQAEERQNDTDRAAQFNAAAEANDPSAYLDTKSKSYDPARAVGVLFRNTQLESATPESIKANLKQAHDIVNTLEERHAGVEEEFNMVKTINAQLKSTDKSDTARVEQLNEMLSVLNEGTKPAKNGAELEMRLETQVSKLNRQLTDSRDLRDEFMQQAEPTPSVSEVDTLVEQANQVSDGDTGGIEVAQSAVNKIINLSMKSSDSLTDEQIDSLITNKDNALSSDERAHLKTVAEARAAEGALKFMGKVSQEILYGSKSNVGISQYKARLAAAFASDNQAVADRQLELLRKFANDHRSKTRAALAAVQPGGSRSIIKTDAGWAVAEKGQKGTMVINSAKLVQNIRTEAAALTKAHAEMKSARDLKFGVESKSSAKTTEASQINLPKENGEEKARPVVPTEPTQVKPPSPPKEVKDVHDGKTFDTPAEVNNYIRDNKLRDTHHMENPARDKYAVVSNTSKPKIRGLREQEAVNEKKDAAVAAAQAAITARAEAKKAADSVVADVVPSDNKVEEQDTGEDIPPPFFKKVMVKLDVWIKDEEVYETMDVPADQALASIREDIDNLNSLLGCMKG